MKGVNVDSDGNLRSKNNNNKKGTRNNINSLFPSNINYFTSSSLVWNQLIIFLRLLLLHYLQA